MKKLQVLLYTLIFISAASLQAEEADGGYANSFTQIPVGARAAALGGSYVSLSNDGSGFFYNPAGLSSARKKIFATSYRFMDLDRSLGYVAFLLPTQGESILGFSWLSAGSGDVAARNSDGDLLGFDLNHNSHQIAVVFAKRFEQFVSLGFKGSYLQQLFAEMSASSVSFDLGATFYLSQLYNREKRDLMPVQDIQAGIVVRNLAASFRWNNEQYYETIESNPFGVEQIDDVPIEIAIGASARFLKRKVLFTTDIVENFKQGITLHHGAEYFVNKEFGLRAGYSNKSLTAGFGYLFALEKFGLALDYAFSSDKVGEGSEHIFSFDFIF